MLWVMCQTYFPSLQDVISEGAGGNMTTTYKSVVYYHEDKPKWAETVKVIVLVSVKAI